SSLELKNGSRCLESSSVQLVMLRRLLRIGVLNHSLRSFHQLLIHYFERFGADAELSPEWAIHGGQQENHQTQDAREYYRHSEVHALAPLVEQPGQRDTEEGSDQQDIAQRPRAARAHALPPRARQSHAPRR